MSRRFSVWQKVVALAPLLLLAVYLPGEMMLRCRIDGLLRPACCCPHGAEPAREGGPTVKAQDCCAREMSTNERPVVEPAQRAADLPVAPVSFPAVLSSDSPLAGRGRIDLTWQAHRPPRGGPPVVLLKHAFLI
jgi:hypothetical protein